MFHFDSIRVFTISMALAVSYSPISHAQQRPGIQQRSQAMTEALAIYALSEDEGRTLPKKQLCTLLQKQGALAALWHDICTKPKLTQDGLGCLRGYFACAQKEEMAGAKMPAGGSFDCEGKLKSCQATHSKAPPTK